ncbi:hypothetical protein ACIHQR_23085 [Corallococcus coralloides]|uniref:hypothetical protein n=1 Tax=Corallococcus coralloides TaxID=184914 RepID=UPI00385143AF
MIKKGTNIPSDHLLAPAFEHWLALMDDPTWLGNDCPWWYNERASISQFAGSIWLTGGWVLEEYSSKKMSPENAKYKGRVDLMFWTNKENGGSKCVAEVKPCSPNLRSQKRIKTIQSAINRATADVRAVRTYGDRYSRIAMFFAAPRIHDKYYDQAEDRIDSFIDALNDLHGITTAWYFRINGNTPKRDKHRFPGAVLGMRTVFVPQ